MAQAFTNITNMKFTEADIGKKVIGNICASAYNITNTGLVGVIMNVLQNGTIGIVGDDCTEYYVEPECFDLLEPEKKFKPGDKVKINLVGVHNQRRNNEIVNIHSYTETITAMGLSWDIYAVYGDSVSDTCKKEINGVLYDTFSEEFLEPLEEELDTDVCKPIYTLPTDLAGPNTLSWSNVTAEAPVLTKSTLDRMVYATHTPFSENCFSKIYTAYEEMVDATKHSVIGKPYIESDLFIKTNKYKDMNIIDKIRVNIKGEPMKTLIENDILTLDERLTNTGKELFMDFLYAKFKDEFVADLAPKLEGLNDDK